jgi:hypothetical protein
MGKVDKIPKVTVFHCLFSSLMAEYETFNSVYGPIKKPT